MPRGLAILAIAVLVVAMLKSPGSELLSIRKELEELRKEMDTTPQKLLSPVPSEVRALGKIPAFDSFDRMSMSTGSVIFYDKDW